VYYDNFTVAATTSNVVEINAYYPYGMLLPALSLMAPSGKWNGYKYSGKELQKEMELNWGDHGARMADYTIGRWWVPDPLAEKYYSFSPYSFAGNNPINFVDPTGMEVEPSSLKEWEKLKRQIENQINKLQSSVDKLTAKAEAKGWSADKLASKIDNKTERITSLNSSIETMGTLESSSQVYGLSHTKFGENGGISLKTGTDVVNIKFGGTANFVHEMTHAGQFEMGDFALDRNSSATFAQDVYDEVFAYKAQFGYSPSSVSGLTSTSVANSFGAITPAWVQGLAGGTLYAPGGSANTGLTPLNVNSTKADFIKAYPNDPNIRLLPANFILRTLPNVYYKR
jgi:RHS repeat-associated protein